jgi:hypothetical protein
MESTCVATGLDRDGGPQPSVYAGIEPLPLVQHWCGGMPREQGHAFAAHDREGIRFYAWFEEAQPFTTATANNQKLYLLGSVAEFFIHPQGSSVYWELHLAPNGLIMALRIPDRDGLLAGTCGWDELTAVDPRARYRVVAGADAWSAELHVPWATFARPSIPVGEDWGFAVCRYNYPGVLANPELSATAPFARLSFHRLEDYHRLTFGPSAAATAKESAA